MNPNVELESALARLRIIGNLHAQDPDAPRLCQAGCRGSWPCDTRRVIDDDFRPWVWPPAEDAPSARPLLPQTAENPSGVHRDTPAVSEPSETLTVTMASYPVPLADGTCNHGRRVRFNLAAGIIRHDSGNPCDGWVLTRAEEEALTQSEDPAP